MTTQVKLTTDGSLARICFEADNGIQLLTRDVREGLRGILDELELRPQISVVLFEAKGRVFIAGADINELLALTAETAADNSREGQAMMSRIEKLPATTVIAMHAACAGGGCELALACDMRIAGESAVIGLPETRIGIVADLGSLQYLPGIIGEGPTRELALTAKDIDAARALQLNLVAEVLDDHDALLARAREEARTIAGLPPLVVQGVKEVMNVQLAASLDERGVRERALKDALADHLPVFGLDDVDD